MAEILIGAAGTGANAAKNNPMLETLATAGLRFSPNSRLTTDAPLPRPILVALRLQKDQKDQKAKADDCEVESQGCVLALSLSEAESLRRALEKLGPSPREEKLGISCDSCDVTTQFSLHFISESPMFDTDVINNKVSRHNPPDSQMLV